MSEEIRTMGVIMRTSALGESSKAAVCFTQKLGRISIAVNGVKKITGKLSAAAQLFAFSNMRIVKGRGNMYTLIGAEIIDSFFDITQDYDTYNIACNITARTIPVIQEDLEDPECFELYVQTLSCLNKNIKKPDFVEAVYYIKLLDISGWTPDIEELSDKGYKLSTLKAITYIFECDINKIYSFTVSDDVLLEIKNVAGNMIDKFLR